MTRKRLPEPPRLARWLLASVLPRDARTDAIVGDLHESFDRSAGRRPWAARGRYWFDAAGIVWRYARAGLIRTGRGGGMRGRPFQDLGRDVRFALRGLRRDRGFTFVALLTLALGVGANTAVFSVVNGILLRPLPYRAPGEIVLLHEANPRAGEMLGPVSFEDLGDWRARSRTVAGMAGFASVPMILTGRSDPAEVATSYVTPEFFDVIDVGPEIGRPLNAEDHRLARRSAVLSERVWRTAFAGDGNAVGESVTLGGEPYTVVGVMPGSMRYLTGEADVWIPLSLAPANVFANGMPARGDRYLRAFGRLAPGMDTDAATRELSRISAELAATHPDTNRDWTAATVVSLQEAIVGDVDEALAIVLGVAGFILLIGCANLANLLLARGSARRREFAVRASLGAGHGRVARQLMTESLVLAVLGGALGLALSYGGVRSIIALGAATLPRVEDVRMDASVLAFALVLSVITGILFGVVPALRLARRDPRADLHGSRGAVGGDGERLRHALAVTEVALAVVLLTGAGLMGRSFFALRSVEPGFDPEHVLTATMQLNLSGVPQNEWAGFLVERREEILDRARELSGVESVGMINAFPLVSGTFTVEYARTETEPGVPGVFADTRYVDPGYVATMRIPLLAGEGLPDELPRGAPVPVLVSESAARALWPTEPPVGRRIRVPWGESTVVGVVGDVRQASLSSRAHPAVYFPQRIAPRIAATLVVRTIGDPAALAGPVRGLVKEIDPNQPIRSLAPLEQLMADSIAQDRFYAVLFAVFGGLGITLAAIGVYGVLAYSVRRRTREIGVRVALGASSAAVLRLVGVSGMKMVGLGLLLGTVAAAALSRVLASQLYGIASTDPASFGLATALLAGAALLAIWVPARRALRVPPASALQG